MPISFLTFCLRLGLFFFCMPQVYGLASSYGLAEDDPRVDKYSEEALAKHVYAYSFTPLISGQYASELDGDMVKDKILSDIYQVAMQLYRKKPSHDPFKSQLALYDLKGKMGKQQKWDTLLVRGYVRLHLSRVDNEKGYLMPEELLPLIENFVMFGCYQEIEHQVLTWAVNDWMNVGIVNFIKGSWTFITEWLAEGMDDPTLCRDINFLKARDDEIYTNAYAYSIIDTLPSYKNNFLNRRLLQWLIDEKQWPTPTDAYIARCNVWRVESVNSTRLYKMRCSQFLKDKHAFLYELQCVHTLNKSLITTLHPEDDKEQMRTIRTKAIAHNPYLGPLSSLSIAYWRDRKRSGGTIAGCNVVHDLLHIIATMIRPFFHLTTLPYFGRSFWIIPILQQRSMMLGKLTKIAKESPSALAMG